MASSKSIVADKPGGAEDGPVQSKDAVPRQRMNVQMVQNVLLIWLDNNIDENTTDCHNTLTQLRRVVNDISIYTDEEQCVQFLETVMQEKACMIISGSLGQQLVPRVHKMSQVDSIFIFCGNKKYHTEWTKKWSKIMGVYTEIGPICEALEKAAEQCEQDSMPISFVTISDDESKKNLDQLPPSFMYTQILKEILLSITFEYKHINEFIQYCREALSENEAELKNVKKFKREYREKTPIWWYTYQCFLYPMLNRALRVLDVNLIVTMGFFITDLHKHIEQLHREQFVGHHSQKGFTVYRGQGLSKADFKQMMQTKGGLMSFNNFLSASKARTVSLRFAHGAVTNPEMMGVLFVMVIEPTQSNTPFALINHVSYLKKTDDEILFSMHTVFRIGEITPIDENSRLFQVNLVLIGDNDKDLCILTDCIREETFSTDKGWFRFGLVLQKMGQFEKAQQVYEILLEQTTNESEKGGVYDRLASTIDNQGRYEEAIKIYVKALAIHEKTLPPTDLNLAVCYNNIGKVYGKMDDYPKALSFYEKVFIIRQQSLPPNHPDLAFSYGKIGEVYFNMKNYPKAHSFYERAVDIGQQSLPPNHPKLKVFRNNLERVEKQL